MFRRGFRNYVSYNWRDVDASGSGSVYTDRKMNTKTDIDNLANWIKTERGYSSVVITFIHKING